MKTDRTSQYRAGFLDAFNDRPAMYLGIDWYKIGFEGGLAAKAHPEDAELVSERPCVGGVERVYQYRSKQVTLRFSNAHLEWTASVPGYGGYPALHAETALLNVALV